MMLFALPLHMPAQTKMCFCIRVCIIIGPAQTKVCSGAGAAARWEETFVFNILDEHKTIQLTVMDKDTFSADDLLGSVQGVGVRFNLGFMGCRCLPCCASVLSWVRGFGLGFF
jgi:hypothetical protein